MRHSDLTPPSHRACYVYVCRGIIHMWPCPWPANSLIPPGSRDWEFLNPGSRDWKNGPGLETLITPICRQMSYKYKRNKLLMMLTIYYTTIIFVPTIKHFRRLYEWAEMYTLSAFRLDWVCTTWNGWEMRQTEKQTPYWCFTPKSMYMASVITSSDTAELLNH